MPLWIRKAIVDFIENGLAALFALNFVIPGDLNAAKAEAMVVGVTLLGVLISAIRRAIPAFLVWLNGKLGTTDGN